VNKIKAIYLQQMEKLNTSEKRTDLQNYIYQLPQSKEILKSNAQEEEKKELEEPTATCTIEILSIEGKAQDNDQNRPTVAHCIDFTYRDKSKNKVDVSKNWIEHFKAMRTLLNMWDNFSPSEI